MSAVLGTHRTGGVGTHHEMENKHKKIATGPTIVVSSPHRIPPVTLLNFPSKIWGKTVTRTRVNMTWWPVTSLRQTHTTLNDWRVWEKKKEEENNMRVLPRRPFFFFLLFWSFKRSRRNSLEGSSFIVMFFNSQLVKNTHRLCRVASAARRETRGATSNSHQSLEIWRVRRLTVCVGFFVLCWNQASLGARTHRRQSEKRRWSLEN